MTTTVVPQLVDALVALAESQLTGRTVSDGPKVGGDPGDYLLVGAPSLDDSDQTTAAESESSWAYAGHRVRNEMGDVNCIAYSWNGDGDQKAARDSALATMDGLSDALRDDPTVGLPASLVMRAEFGTRVEWVQVQDGQGAAARAMFTVHFQAQV